MLSDTKKYQQNLRRYGVALLPPIFFVMTGCAVTGPYQEKARIIKETNGNLVVKSQIDQFSVTYEKDGERVTYDAKGTNLIEDILKLAAAREISKD